MLSAKQIKKLQSGDHAALKEWVEEMKPHLFRFSFYLTGNEQDAEELTHETFSKALRSLNSLNDGKGVKSWLLLIAKNTWIDFKRSNESKVASATKEPRESDAGTDQPLDRVPDCRATSQETLVAVKAALNALDPEERAMLLMVDEQGYSYEEVAEMNSISTASVRMKLHRARKAFIEKYESS